MNYVFKIVGVNMKKIVFITILYVLSTTQTYAQAPNWSVDANNFEYTMTFLAFLTVNGNRLESTNDRVAVFVNNEVRGTCNLTYVESQDKYFAYLTAFSNDPNEILTVKVYDSQNDQVHDISATFNFEINKHLGTLFQAISWAEPALNSEAEITTFGFDGISILQETIENNNITLVIENTFDITTLTPVFEVSENATVFKDNLLQTSGQNPLDFSNTITYQVRSEDQSALTTWTVSVVQIENDLIYQKRNAVCFQKGAIKISTSRNGEEIQLWQNDTLITSETIANNEVIFNELNAGFYTVKLGNTTKMIRIDLNTN